jgi:hypothetical protein
MPTLKQNGLSIVAVGDFNSKIFQPSWFVAEHLISETEAKEPTELFIEAHLSTFKLPWVAVRVTPQQFIVQTTQDSHSEALRDLVLGTFRLLSHTPITQLGINVDQHYLCEDMEHWNNFGHQLAPKSEWLKVMKDPGLVSMKMKDKAAREGGPPGYTQVDVASSGLFQPGIFFLVNNHYEWSAEGGAMGATTMTKILESNFASALANSKGIIDNLISLL